MSSEPKPKLRKVKYHPVLGPRLSRLVSVLLGSFALLAANGAYLSSVTLAEWYTELTYQDYFYQWMFLGHLLLGLAMMLPVVIFGIAHIRVAHDRPNRRAVRVGYALFAVTLILFASGVALTRIEGLIDIRDETSREVLYWVHVIAPLAAMWLFILHRLAGRKIRWRVGLTWLGVTAAFVIIMLIFHSQDPRRWNEEGPASGEQYFFPSLSRTATGNFIPAENMMRDQYCIECHEDVHEGWANSVHRFSSFNNPAYLFSVRGTRKVALERDGDVQASRFCAGCHDPVPFFSGAFDDPNFDDEKHPTSQAGITCTVCHAITHINSPRGNSDYTIEEPLHYPLAFSSNSAMRWVSKQLVKSKPAFHKKTFLKELHKTPEFCGTCHKVHLPEELNKYRFLRGQNHYDSYHLSGVSGHGVASFYYPPKAEDNCNNCHMEAIASDDFGARDIDGEGVLQVHNHQFPSANTAIPQLLELPEWVNEAHTKFLEGSLRVDIFGVRDGDRIDSELHAPLRPEVPSLKRGNTYLLEVVLRTMRLGHLFTQGTADSNEVWVEVDVQTAGRTIGKSGGKAGDGAVDPWSHFVNAYILDRNGDRIDRRNAEDIFVPLYNHQIPPGGADLLHYRLSVPEDAGETVRVRVSLHYRKFDTIYMKHVYGEDYKNDLPIVTIASDEIVFPVGGEASAQSRGTQASKIVPWQRWNDFGIGLLRKGSKGSSKGELRQAEEAFQQVETLGRPDGPINLARVYLKEGRLADAVQALQRAVANPEAMPWIVDWLTGQVNKRSGQLDAAIQNFVTLVQTKYPAAVERGFDFSQDYRLLNILADTYFQRAELERGDARKETRTKILGESLSYYQRALVLDPENVTGHYGASLVLRRLGRDEEAKVHEEAHARFKPDDNSRDRAVAAARAGNPAADHAAEAIVIYDLQRSGAFELGTKEEKK